MSDKFFRDFLADFQEILHSDPGVRRTEPVSPPGWSKMGWLVGWIAEEGHTGIQFILTEEKTWPVLSRHWGSSRAQKSQVFSDRYASLLKDLGSELGKPVSLKSLKWRKVDLEAFPGRELVENQQWWRIDFESRRMGTWHFLFPDRFYGLFEDKNTTIFPEPPWQFSELWKQLSKKLQRQLLQRLGRDRNNLNHLAGLVASGVLEGGFVRETLARNPSEEFEQALQERQELLQSKSSQSRRRTQNQWKKDANKHLTQQVGTWLEENELAGSPWQLHEQEWKDYRQEQREARYSTTIWKEFWKRLNDDQLKQLVPRLDDALLARASAQLPASLRKEIAEHARPELARQLRDDSPACSREQVYRAREKLAGDLEEWGQQFGIDWKWDVGDI